MIDTAQVLKYIDEQESFIGPGLPDIWRMVATGLRDHKTGEIVKGWQESHLHSGGRLKSYKSENFPGMDLSQVSGWTPQEKRVAANILHLGPAYQPENIEKMLRWQFERMIKVGTRKCHLISDTTTDIGLRDFDIHMNVRNEYPEIETLVGCYFLNGFYAAKGEPDRLRVGVDAIEKGADFIVGLPDRDVNSPIGFEGHVSTILDLAWKYKSSVKFVQFHADEMRTDTQHDTLRIIRCLQALTPDRREYFTAPGKPKVWAVHVISPSCYAPEKFSRLLELMVKYNIGVVCAPLAGISDRALRTEYGPLSNGIARVLEMACAGVWVTLGSDNVGDLFMPLGSGLVLWQITPLADAVREYSYRTLAKLGMGMKLDDADRASLERSLEQTRDACMKHKENLEKQAERKPLYDF